MGSEMCIRDRARVALNRHLLMHTLEVIEAWRGDLAQCIVVSPCEDALACAHAAGAQALREPAGAAGLNAAPDRAGSGTNALVLSAEVRDIFRFGADSCAQHRAALAGAGSRCVVYERAEFAFDLDTPQDYAEWTAQRDARIPRGISPPAQHQLEEAGK